MPWGLAFTRSKLVGYEKFNNEEKEKGKEKREGGMERGGERL